MLQFLHQLFDISTSSVRDAMVGRRVQRQLARPQLEGLEDRLLMSAVNPLPTIHNTLTPVSTAVVQPALSITTILNHYPPINFSGITLSTTSGYAPGYSASYLQNGSAVIISPEGSLSFPPGTMVQFGKSGPLAPTVPFGPNHAELLCYVPRYAITGPLGVILPNGTVIQSAQTFTVHDYINTYGFNFHNFGFNVTWGMVEGEFGWRQTDFTVSFPTGLTSTKTVDTGIPDPYALAFWGIMAAELNGNGACFGMSLESAEMAASGTNVYTLQQTGGLVNSIEQNCLAQGSTQMLNYFLSWELSGHSAQGIYNQLSALLYSGDHPIISIRNGTEGHALVAYDLEPGPLGNGDYYIDVYDCNQPSNSNNDTTQEQASRIYINPSCGWSYTMAGGSIWSGGLGAFSDMMVIPSSVVSGNLTMPTADLAVLQTIICAASAPSAPAGTTLTSRPLANLFWAEGSASSMKQTGEVQQSSDLVISSLPQGTPFNAVAHQVAGAWTSTLAERGQEKHTGRTDLDAANLTWLESAQMVAPPLG